MVRYTSVKMYLILLISDITLHLQVEKHIKKEHNKLARIAVIAEREKNKHIVYGLGFNCLFLRICQQAINIWRDRRYNLVNIG